MSSYKSFAFEINEEFEIQNNNMPDEFIDSDCIAHIRPRAGYNESAGFGFDWMRIADTPFNGDYVYEDIVGKLYTPYNDLVMDANEYDDLTNKFRKDEGMYKRLENEYNLASRAKVFIKSKNVTTKKTELKRYYVPILALGRSIKAHRPMIKETKRPSPSLRPLFTDMGGEGYVIYAAKLELRLDIKISPTEIYWKFPDGYNGTTKLDEDRPADIIVSSKKIPTIKGTHNIDIEVMCFADLSKTVDIKLMAKSANGKSKMIGAFRIWKNKTKKVKVAIVQVVTNFNKDNMVFLLNDLYAERDRIRKYLCQALLSPDITIIEKFKMDEKSGLFSSGRNLDGYMTSGGSLIARNDYKRDKDVYKYLKESFEKEHKGYEDAVKIFYINEDAVNLINDGTRNGKRTDFYAASRDGMNTILFSRKGIGQVWTSAHETLHALGLNHSFTNVEVSPDTIKYTYKPCVTDNIMDYTKSNGNLFNLWYWQWKILNK